MARTITMREAINEALDQEMARDPSVVLMGEDIVGGAGSPGEDDAWGGVLGVTKGLYAKYGRERLLDTPLSESAYIGAAIGAATCGLRRQHRRLRAHGAAGGGSGRHALHREHLVRGHRPPHALAARPRHRAGERGADRAAGVRRRGHAALQHRRRRVGPGGPGGVLVTAGRDRDGQRSPHAGAVLARPRRRLCPERGEGGQRRAPHDGEGMTAAEGITPVVMPKWGLSMKEGKVVTWLVADGDDIAVGTELMDVETDKINGTVEATDAGRLRRRVAEEGHTYPVKALLGVLAGEEVSDEEIDAFIASYVVPADEEDGEAEGEYDLVEVGGIRVRYSRQGEGGKTVVLLHGF